VLKSVDFKKLTIRNRKIDDMISHSGLQDEAARTAFEHVPDECLDVIGAFLYTYMLYKKHPT
jgi:hypothetical protein